MEPDTSNPADVVARTLWGEARGCGAAGMRHVASVILNRASHPTWWGSSPVSVCLQPFQFSCWNVGHPYRAKLLAVTEQDPSFVVALGIARTAIAGQLVDETGGSDSYYALSMTTPPNWAAKAVRTFSDGWHAFFRFSTTAPTGPAEPHVPNVSIHTVPPVDEADALDNLYNKE